MKRLLPVLLVIPLLMGAAGVPAPPSDNFLLNDNAAVLTEEEREDVGLMADGLYDETGARLVFLSVESPFEAEPAAYADEIIKGWGFTESDALFLVYPSGLEERSLLIGESADGQWKGTVRKLGDGDVMGPYRSLVSRLYKKHGVTPMPEARELLDDGFGPLDIGAAIFIAVVLIAVTRTFRLDRKYKGKYLAGNVRRRRSYARIYNEEDEYNNEKIYKITYDDMD